MDLITTLSAIGGLLLILVGLGTVIFKIGKSDQRAASNFEAINETLAALRQHVDDRTIHINPELQQHLKDEQATWRKNVDDKLNLLLTTINKGN